jgi:hypothetical protein
MLNAAPVILRDVNGAEIDRRIGYFTPLPRHLKYSSFSASGRILPPSPFPRMPKVSDGYQPTLKKYQISIIFNRTSGKQVFKFNYKKK